MMRAALFLGLGLVACADGADKADPTPTGDTGGPQACTNALDATIPEDGATEVYHRVTVRMTLDDEDATASIAVVDADGKEVVGKSEVDGKTVAFTPAEPYANGATYTATLTYECTDPESISFTTSDVGQPLAVDPVGRVYKLDLTQGDWVKPAGVGSLIVNLITDDISVFLMPSAIDEKGKNTIDFIGAPPNPSNTSEQDPCSAPFFVDGATWDAPHFEGNSDSLAISVLAIDVNIQNLGLSGDIAPDGSSIEIGAFSGEIDAREIEAGFPDVDLCSLVPGGCQPCSAEATSKTCLEARIENLSLPYLDNVPSLVAEPECPKQ